jgi:hypothetical protein
VSFGVHRPIAPQSNITAQSTVSTEVSAQKLIHPTGVNSLAAVSAKVIALRKIAPTSIAATSIVSGSEQTLRRISPATIAATSTLVGSGGSLKRLVPAQINAASSASAALRARRAVAGGITAKSIVDALLTNLMPILPAQISALSSVIAIVTTPSNRPVTGGNIMASSTITVFSCTLIVSPDTVTGPVFVTITWSGRTQPAIDDFIAVFPHGAPSSPANYIDWFYVNSNSKTPGAVPVASGSVTFQMPSTDGDYDFRYFGNNVFNLLATTLVTELPGLRLTPQNVNAQSTVSAAVAVGRGVSPAFILALSHLTLELTNLYGVSGTILAKSIVSGFIQGNLGVFPGTRHRMLQAGAINEIPQLTSARLKV